MNSLGESAENQVFRVRKPSVQKNKCFVCVYAGNKSSVNTPSGLVLHKSGGFLTAGGCDVSIQNLLYRCIYNVIAAYA